MRLRSRLLLRTTPLFPVAVGLTLGIVVDERWHLSEPSYWAFFLAALTCAMVGAIRGLIGPLLIAVSAGCAGGLLHLSAVRTQPPSSIVRYVNEPARIARVRGMICSSPRLLTGADHPFKRWIYRGDRTVFLLDAESIEGLDGDISVTGRLRVTVRDAVLDLRENERVTVVGWLYRFRPPANPGSFDWARFHRRRGIVAGLSCTVRQNVSRIDIDPPPALGRLARVRTHLRGLLTDDLATGTHDQASLLEAMVLGHRSGLDRRINDVFIRAGCVHFLAVSGVHVVIVMFLARMLAKMLFAPPRWQVLAMMASVIAYAVVTEPRPSILRATVMALLYCGSRLLGREGARLNWICAAAVVLLVMDPAMTFDIGYQLSFGAVLGVSYLGPRVLDLMAWLRTFPRRSSIEQSPARELPIGSRTAWRGVGFPTPLARGLPSALMGYVLRGLAVSCGAWLASMPIVALHFQRIQPWGALNSALVFPLVTVVMALGFARVAMGMISPWLGALIAWPLGIVDAWLISLAQRLGELPGASLSVSPPSWWVMLSYYVFLLMLVWCFPRKRFDAGRTLAVGDGTAAGAADNVSIPESPRGPKPAARDQETETALVWPRRCCALASLVLVAAGVTWCRPRASADRLVVTVLSVGAGSATVIELPDGSVVLYDAGTSSPYDVGRSTVVPYLRHRGIQRIHSVYLSHPNLDHFSGLPSIVNEVPTGTIMLNQHFEARSPPKSPSRHLLDLLRKRGHGVKAVDVSSTGQEIGGVLFEQLWPPRASDAALSVNDTSTVFRLSYAGRSILLPGDIEDRAQRSLLERGDLHADVLVLPHHGSVRASTEAFLDAVGADVLIRSSHRRMADTDNGLRRLVGSAALLNTADVGAIRIVFDKGGVDVRALGPSDAAGR